MYLSCLAMQDHLMGQSRAQNVKSNGYTGVRMKILI